MVFYFTGTGNSLYIARRIDKDAVSIPQVMRGRKSELLRTRQLALFRLSTGTKCLLW